MATGVKRRVAGSWSGGRWYLEQGVEELEGRVVADAAENGAKREQGRRRGGAREPSISTSLPVITKLCSPLSDE